MNDIANNIYKYRTRKNITQKALADYLNVQPSTISNWEKGNHEPSLDSTKKLAYFFNITVAELLGRAVSDSKIDPLISKNLESYQIINYYNHRYKVKTMNIVFLLMTIAITVISMYLGEIKRSLFVTSLLWLVIISYKIMQKYFVKNKNKKNINIPVNFQATYCIDYCEEKIKKIQISRVISIVLITIYILSSLGFTTAYLSNFIDNYTIILLIVLFFFSLSMAFYVGYSLFNINKLKSEIDFYEIDLDFNMRKFKILSLVNLILFVLVSFIIILYKDQLPNNILKHIVVVTTLFTFLYSYSYYIDNRILFSRYKLCIIDPKNNIKKEIL